MTEIPQPDDIKLPAHPEGQLPLPGMAELTPVESQLAKAVLGPSPAEAKEAEYQPKTWALEEFGKALKEGQLKTGDQVVGLNSKKDFRMLEALICSNITKLPIESAVRQRRFAGSTLDSELMPKKFHGELINGVAILSAKGSTLDRDDGEPRPASSIHGFRGIGLVVEADLKSTGRPALGRIERSVTYRQAAGLNAKRHAAAYGGVSRQVVDTKEMRPTIRTVQLHNETVRQNAHDLQSRAMRNPLQAGAPSLGKRQ